MVIDRAEELFATGAEIGVSSISSDDVTYFDVRRYFEHLMALNYDEVNIKWYDIQYISDLEQQPDGSYVELLPFTSVLKAAPMMGWSIKTQQKRTLRSLSRRKRPRSVGVLSTFGMCC